MRLYRYVVPSLPDRSGGWAIVVIGSDGYFSTVSDYGNYAFRWTSTACDDFRTFMVRSVCKDHSYTMSKLGRMSFSERGTREHIEAELRKAFAAMTDEEREEMMVDTHDRRSVEGIDSAEELLDYELGLVRGVTNEVEFVDWAKETIFYRDEPWNMSVQDYDGDLRAFSKYVLPRLGAMIAEEMAAEARAQTTN